MCSNIMKGSLDKKDYFVKKSLETFGSHLKNKHFNLTFFN